MQTNAWRQTAYQWCQHGCLGLVAVNLNDASNSAVNGAPASLDTPYDTVTLSDTVTPYYTLRHSF